MQIVTWSYTQQIWNCVLYYTKSFPFKSLSVCNEDKTLTVASSPWIFTPARTRSKHIFLWCFIIIFAWPNTWKRKQRAWKRLNCNLASKTARTTDCQNSGEFNEAHSLYSGFKSPFWHMQIWCTFADSTTKGLKRAKFATNYKKATKGLQTWKG